jgi:hypothetical protein
MEWGGDVKDVAGGVVGIGVTGTAAMESPPTPLMTAIADNRHRTAVADRN